jgi:hypothetical protein
MPGSPSKSKRRGWEDSTWGEKMPISGITSLTKDKKSMYRVFPSANLQARSIYLVHPAPKRSNSSLTKACSKERRYWGIHGRGVKQFNAKYFRLRMSSNLRQDCGVPKERYAIINTDKNEYAFLNYRHQLRMGISGDRRHAFALLHTDNRKT